VLHGTENATGNIFLSIFASRLSKNARCVMLLPLLLLPLKRDTTFVFYFKAIDENQQGTMTNTLLFFSSLNPSCRATSVRAASVHAYKQSSYLLFNLILKHLWNKKPISVNL
jgi:hypothetical protein